jgi:hypothetical protein
MAKTTQRTPKRYFGMTAFQIIVIFLLGLLTLGVIGLAVTLITGNSIPNIGLPGLGVLNPSKAILGKWERYVEPTRTSTGCNLGYPPTIEFFSDGTYVGTSIGIWSDFFVWQGGQYEILDDGRIKMQTKNGFAVYKLSMIEDKLTFTDDSACEFTYQRASLTSFTNTAIEYTPEIATSPPALIEIATPIIQSTPSRTNAPTWTSIPEMMTPSRTKAPTWTLLHEYITPIYTDTPTETLRP